jgi:rRNA maturation protein Nop10
MPYSDSLCAYCPDCGRPNYWAGPPKFDDEADTEPFGKMLKEYLDDDTAD